MDDKTLQALTELAVKLGTTAEYLSNPICGRPAPNGYRMTINVPLANECKNCRRVLNAKHGR